jgi:serine/threonine-protein kinase
MPPHDADRNLLFGFIALQMDFISRDQLVAAMQSWVFDKRKPLGQILCQQGVLSLEDHEAIETLVRRHLLRHDNDAERSLASLSSIGPVRDALARIADPDVQASLPRVGAARSDGDTTLTYVGSPTTPGGRFRILRWHAQGGLGVLSVALDEELHREVALKEIQERYANEMQPRLRFLLEAEITGGLEHPGIVPVYGLGHHPDGRPFYAMRFVRGQSLKEAAARFHASGGSTTAAPGSGGQPLAQASDNQPAVRLPVAAPRAILTHSTKALELRGLLSRFLDVCNAIAYAHSRGVLHRDIKPGNVLLGPFGETLVVDWGLAKIIGRDETGSSEPNAEPTLRPPSASGTGETIPGTALGTPAYMSPEQAEGRLDLLGPASDVYSLGATLYAVLTGRAPFDRGDATEVLPKVRRGDFARPRALNPSIPKPLEAICLKAMALNQADRYATPRALAEDIEHWLADEPVLAYREPWPDRARRWSRRHRTLVTSAAAVLLLGLMGSVSFAAVVTAKNRELAKQTRRAQAREEMAINAVERFRDVVVEEPVLKNNPSLEALRKKLLKAPLDFFKLLREQLQADKETSPLALARLARAAHEYAHVTGEMGDIQDALRSHVESLAIWEKLVREHPARIDYQRGLATIENCRALILLDTGHPDQALVSYGNSLAVRELLARENPRVASFQSELALTYINVGNLQHKTGHPDQAMEFYNKALAIQELLALENTGETAYRRYVAACHYQIGTCQRTMGRLEAALASYRRALAIQQQLASEQPSLTTLNGELAMSHQAIGVLQGETSQLDQALDSHGKALALFEKLASQNPSLTTLQRSIAQSRGYIGALQFQAGHPDLALDSYDKELAIVERLARENPSVTETQTDLAGIHNNVGMIRSKTGHPAQALESYAKALMILERLVRENPSVIGFQFYLATTHNNIGSDQRKTGDAHRALAAHAKALAIRAQLAREHPESPDYASSLGATLNNMATIDMDAKRFDQARDKLRQAISWQQKALAINPGHPIYRQFLRNHLANLVKAARALARDDEARAAEHELDGLAATDPAKVALNHRLDAVMRGVAPKDDRERLQLADWAYQKAFYSLSARLYADTLEANPKLADDRKLPYRYDAACSAALAAAASRGHTALSSVNVAKKIVADGVNGAGSAIPQDTIRGNEEPVTEAERARLRNQARAWLEAELNAWSKLLGSATPQQRAAIAGTLKHWQEDTDLAGVRDESALTRLPQDERNAWKSLWTKVDALLAKARKA